MHTPNLAVLQNLTSYVAPIAVQPLFPNFAFCHPAYGTGLKKDDGLHTGGILPQGINPVPYTVNHEASRASKYHMPLKASFAGVTITVEVGGPVEIDSMILIPNDLRGMAAYLATFCAGRYGTGGFVTRRLQGLMDYVTDPQSDLDVARYPDSTAFITVTMSSPDKQTLAGSAGDYDPQMALFLQDVEMRTLDKVPPMHQSEIAIRSFRYSIQAKRMQRLGKVPWWDHPLGQMNGVNRTLEEQSRYATATAVQKRRRNRRPQDNLEKEDDENESGP